MNAPIRPSASSLPLRHLAPAAATAAALSSLLLAAGPAIASSELALRFLADVRRSELPNGVTVLVRPQPGTGVVAIDTWVEAGYFHEPDEKAGMAHLFEHMFFKGSKQFPGPERIAQELAAVGGRSNAGTIYDSTNYYFVVPSAGFARAAEIMADAIANPLFDAAELAKEAEVVIEESNRKQDNPQPLSLERMLATSFTEHRVRRWRIGSNEVLRGIRRDDLLAFFDTLYRPENLIVSVAGDIDPAVAEATVARTFGSIPKGKLDKRRGPSEPPQTAFRFGRSSGDLSQGWSVLGWHTQGVGGDDETTLDLVAAILGQGRSSRFFRHVIGEDGAATATADHWQFEDVGALIVQASFDESRRDEVDRRLLAEVARLAAHGPTAYELRVAKNALAAAQIQGLESSLGQATALAQAEARGGYRTLATRLARLEATAADAVRDAARRYLTVDRLTLYHYTPNAAPAVEPDHALAAARAALAAPPPAEPAVAAPAAWASLPAASVDRPPTVSRLPNGATLVVRERPGAPTVAAGVFFAGGRIDESSANAGITRLMANGLRRGTATRSGEQLDRELELLGTQLDVTVERDAFGLSVGVIASNLEPAMTLLAEVVGKPAFPAAGVAEERALQLAALKRSLDSSLQRPLALALRDLYGAHPYALPELGSELSVAALGEAAVRDWWTRTVRAETAVILVVGDVTADAARRLVETHFAALPAGTTASAPGGDGRLGAPAPPLARTETAELRDRKQSAIVMAFAGPRPESADAARLELLQRVTSGLSGTLFAELRGRRSLAYTVFAGYQPGREAGTVIAYLATDAKKEDEARAALHAELLRLGADGFGEVELERAKAAYAGATLMDRETNGGLLAELAENILLGLGPDATDSRLAVVRATTLEELRATARTYFGAERFATAVLRGKS